MRAVIGKVTNQTAFFYDTIKTVNYHPYWGVPQSIIVNEMLPKLRSDPGYLDRAGYEVTEEEWSLLTDSADLLAYGQLKLNTDDYDTNYYTPAFEALDQAGTCEEKGPEVEEVLSELVDRGGSREALPDQDLAYEEWRALMDRLQAEANEPAPTKTKTK